MSALPKDAAAPFAEPKQAVAEVAAGRPGPTARRWLGPTALVVFALFAAFAAGTVMADEPLKYPDTKRGTQVDDYHALPVDDDVEDATCEIACHQVDLFGSKGSGQHAHAGLVIDDVLAQDLVKVLGRRLRRARDGAGGDDV